MVRVSAAFTDRPDVDRRPTIGHHGLAVDGYECSAELCARGSIPIRSDPEETQLELMAWAWKRTGPRLADLVLFELPEHNHFLVLVEQFEEHATIHMDWEWELIAARKEEHIDIEGVYEPVVIGIHGILIRGQHDCVHAESGGNVDASGLLARWWLRTIGHTGHQCGQHDEQQEGADPRTDS